MKPAAARRVTALAAGLLLANAAGAAATGDEPDEAPEDDQQPTEPDKPAKSYFIPAFDIIGFDFLLNRFNHLTGDETADVTMSTIKDNIRNGFVRDSDPFQVNQIGHPYQGSMYHGFARSAGLNYWESSAYTFAGSLLWEIAGETTQPSYNDQVASGIGGSFLGEPLFRMANLVLERSTLSPFWRELSAALISPATGFNRLAFDRFDDVFPSNDPFYYSRVQVGYATTTRDVPGTSTQTDDNEGLADFSMQYGLPGNPAYDYSRPFDYFSFQFTASTANAIENVLTHGLVWGRASKGGGPYRGIWGLYGSFDYISPQVFRVSSTALSLGTTGQAWLTENVALQGTALLGAGYAAVGTVNGTDDLDYHYGFAPQALLALRMILSDKASLDVTAREYFVTGVAEDIGGHDNIMRADATITFRVHRRHAIAVKYLWSRRDASYADLDRQSQTRATIGIFYTLLGQDRFGAVDWAGLRARREEPD